MGSMDPTELREDRDTDIEDDASRDPDASADAASTSAVSTGAAFVHPRWPGAVLLTAFVVIAADQLTKWWALERLSNGRLIDVVGSLRFNLAFNSGTAFSFGSGLGPLIAVVAVVISLGLWWTSRSMLKTSSLLAVGLVVGGAIGNFLDRAFRPPRAGTEDGLLRGAVVDFIDLQWWPIFNIADAGIVVGGILIVLLGGFGPPIEDEVEAAAAEEEEEIKEEDEVEADSDD